MKSLLAARRQPHLSRCAGGPDLSKTPSPLPAAPAAEPAATPVALEKPLAQFIASLPPTLQPGFDSGLSKPYILPEACEKPTEDQELVRGAAREAWRWLKRKYYLYEVTYGLYVMDPVEKFFLNFFVLTVLALFIFALTSSVSHLYRTGGGSFVQPGTTSYEILSGVRLWRGVKDMVDLRGRGSWDAGMGVAVGAGAAGESAAVTTVVGGW